MGSSPSKNKSADSSRVKETQISAGAASGRVVDRDSDQSSVSGRKLDTNSDTDIVPSVLDLNVSDIKLHNVGCAYVTSVLFMPSGHVVLACSTDGLKLLDKKFKQLSQLSLISTSACKVSDTEVLVSQADNKQIQFVEVLPKMVAMNILTIGRIPRGVCYHNGDIYVVCGDRHEGCEVRVMKIDGTVVRRLGVNDGTCMFTLPDDVKVNNAGDKVFVSDIDTDSVTCMDKYGKLLYQYTDTDLMYPTGMLVDRQDNVLVTGNDSYNLHVINKDGVKHKIVLTERDGMNCPWCISYSQHDGLLAIGMSSDDKTKSLMTVKTSLA